MFSRSSGFGQRKPNDGATPTSTGVVIPITSSSSEVLKPLTPQQIAAGRILIACLRRVCAARSAVRALVLDKDPVRPSCPNALAVWNVRLLHFALHGAWIRVTSKGKGVASASCSDGLLLLQGLAKCFKMLLPIDKTASAITQHATRAMKGTHPHELVASLLTRLSKVAASILASFQRGSSVPPCPPLLLCAVQFFLAAREGGNGDAVAVHCQASLDAIIVRLYSAQTFSLLRSSRTRPPKGTVAPVVYPLVSVLELLGQYIKAMDGTAAAAPTQQEALIADAVYKAAWSAVDAAYRQLTAATDAACATSASAMVHSFCFQVLPSRAAALKSIVNIIPEDNAVLSRRCRLVAWLGARFPCPAGIPSAHLQLVIKLMLVQLLVLSKLLGTVVDATSAEAKMLPSLVDSATLWWWEELFSRSPVAGQQIPLVSDLAKEVMRTFGRDVFGWCDLFSSIWKNDKVVGALCVPPNEGISNPGNTSASHVKTQQKKSRKSEGLFAELRSLTADESVKAAAACAATAVPWTQSLLRKGTDITAAGMEVTMSSYFVTFRPPVWIRGATLLALLCTEALQPLHLLAYHGPRLVHRLLGACLNDPLVPTAVDMLYVLDLRALTKATPAKEQLPAFVPQGMSAASFVATTVKSMALAVNGVLGLMIQLAHHLLLVSGDHDVERAGCPVPLDQLHALVDLCNVFLVSMTRRLLQPSTVRVMGVAAGGALSSSAVLRNDITDVWLREDTFRLRSTMATFVRALMDTSLRIPRLTHFNPNLRRKEQEALQSQQGYADERFWYLDHDLQEELFPGSYQSASATNQKAKGSGLKCPWGPLHVAVLQVTPHVVPFSLRIEYFTQLLAEDRRKFVGTRDSSNLKLGLRIRRDHMLEDLIEQLSLVRSSNPNLAVDGKYLRAKWHIQLIDRQGMAEAGIDAGGVFKEFMERVVKECFNPNLGLFVPVEPDEAHAGEGTSAASRVLHPNPHAKLALGMMDANPQAHLEYIRFLGIVVSKAIYEGVVLNLEFAPSFLNNLLGRRNCIDDLKAVDAQQYRSLQLLKDMDDVADAELYFCVEEEALGVRHTIDLVPDGRNLQVTSENVVRYMHLVANHMLVKRNKEETMSFAAGFFEILPQNAVQFLFNRRELQQLISGRNGLRLDVDDLKKHCRLVGGIEEGSRTLALLWEILEELSAEDQAKFLQFSTGSSKPPLLGFASMNPPFSIRGVEEGSVFNFLVDMDRLPSASTCFNLLKLPLYRNKNNMQEKLLQAIRSDSGFQLS